MAHDSVSVPALTFFGTWVILWITIQMAVYTVMGQYHVQSEDLMGYCRMRCKTKLDVRKVRALRPLRMLYSYSLFVHQDMALGVILIVQDVTINAIFIL